MFQRHRIQIVLVGEGGAEQTDILFFTTEITVFQDKPNSFLKLLQQKEMNPPAPEIEYLSSYNDVHS